MAHRVFDEKDISLEIKEAKEERLDKQYYVEDNTNKKNTEESANDIIRKAESYLIKLKLSINKLSNSQIVEVRNKLKSLLNKTKTLAEITEL